MSTADHRLTLDLERLGDRPRGVVETPQGDRHPFTGWLGLAEAIEQAAAALDLTTHAPKES
jgi:hypothetical protein